MASKSERIQYEDHLVESTAAHDKEDSETQLKRVQSEFRIATGNSLVETPRLADRHVSSYDVYCAAIPTCLCLFICADIVTLEVESCRNGNEWSKT